MNDLIKTLDTYLVKKAPGIPANIKELIVKFSPWLVIISLVLTVPGLLTIFGLGSLAGLGGLAVLEGGFGFSFSMVFLVVMVVLEAMAVPGLMKKTMGGWNFMFYASIVNAVSMITSYNIVSGLISTLISFYILFQVRSYYK